MAIANRRKRNVWRKTDSNEKKIESSKATNKIEIFMQYNVFVPISYIYIWCFFSKCLFHFDFSLCFLYSLFFNNFSMCLAFGIHIIYNAHTRKKRKRKYPFWCAVNTTLFFIPFHSVLCMLEIHEEGAWKTIIKRHRIIYWMGWKERKRKSGVENQ